ncbi:MAG: KpsF/GutQ family sugar-phosphate isomerase [Phycisphaerae bacterium]|nr:KpsF/GutQ family sugar-phosphate isomerase [Phycisphaerae bacterium]MBT5656940.1 KpsF/GutQ family sugar-phosphate isomerase [Phycisphaerae bacterium]
MTTEPRSSQSEATEHEGTLGVITSVLRQEAEALNAMSGSIEQGGPIAANWSAAVKMIDACKGHLVVSGMGKSGLVGAKISATFSSLGIPSHVVHPADAAHGDLGAIRGGDVVMLLSYSGGTAEVVELATILRNDGVATLGVSRNDSTNLARVCETHLALGDLDEAGPLNLAPTTSTTATLACGDALALAVAHHRSFTATDFRRRHPGGSLGAMLRPVEELIRFRPGENLTTITADVPTVEALRLSDKDHAGSVRHAGALLVVDADGCVIGLFTDGDLRRLVLMTSDELSRPIGEVMTKSPRTIHREATLGEARRLVAEYRIDEIPVVDDDGRAVGLIDIQDLMAPRVAVD